MGVPVPIRVPVCACPLLHVSALVHVPRVCAIAPTCVRMPLPSVRVSNEGMGEGDNKSHEVPISLLCYTPMRKLPQRLQTAILPRVRARACVKGFSTDLVLG